MQLDGDRGLTVERLCQPLRPTGNPSIASFTIVAERPWMRVRGLSMLLHGFSLRFLVDARLGKLRQRLIGLFLFLERRLEHPAA